MAGALSLVTYGAAKIAHQPACDVSGRVLRTWESAILSAIRQSAKTPPTNVESVILHRFLQALPEARVT